MSVKSTVRITRDFAVEKYARLKIKEKERMLRAEAMGMGKVELEDVLEQLNDEANGGEGYENYIIEE